MRFKMISNKFLCTMLILSHMMLDLTHCGLPRDLLFDVKGCQSKFFEEKCVDEVYCNSYLNFKTRYSYEYNQCGHAYINDINGNNVFPVRLYYSGPIDENEELNGMSNVQQRNSYAVLYLDLSLNDYYNVPIIQFRNLESLNITFNKIDTAKFSNKYKLNSLHEIDFSYNQISKINIDENEFAYTELKKLLLAHNQLRDLNEAIFIKFSKLELLDLSHNFVTNLTLSTFEGINKLKVLDLSHNNIYDMNSSLFRFSKLKELYLSNNKIKNVLIRDFENLNELEILDLKKNSIVNLDKNVFNNLVHLKKIDLGQNLLSVIDKDTFSTNINLQSIDLSYNELTELPVHLFESKSISFFDIKENNLQGSLKKGVFEGLQFNTKLDVSYQSITSIEDYAFFGLDNIVELLLNNNMIRSLSKKSFNTLRMLTHLDLSFNQITSIDFDKEDLLSLRSLLFRNNHVTMIKIDHLHNLQTLQLLDLSQNNISKIESESFKTLANVNNLIINKNPLVGNLEANTFEGLALVPKLDLSYTLLNTIMNASFDGMINLYDLNISHCEISELDYNTFSNTGNIEILDLSHNKIIHLNVNTTVLKNLKQLLLNNNRITALHTSMFKDMSSLNKISLSSNFIESVDNSVFNEPNNLRYLDLSYNLNMQLKLSLLKENNLLETLILSSSISNITFKELSSVPLINLEISYSNIRNVSKLNLSTLKQVQILNLNNNNVSLLEVGAFSNLSEIKEIDVSYNKINNIQPGVFKDNRLLEKLNVSHNALFALGYGALRGLINLKILDMSFNSIKSLEIERFYEVLDLEELIVDRNAITDLSVEDFSVTKINKLSIGDNPLSCEIVTKLWQANRPEFVITALRHVEDNEENVHGISCDSSSYELLSNSKLNTQQNTGHIKESLLMELKDILLNLKPVQARNDEKKFENEYLFNFTQLLKSSHLDNINEMNRLNNETLQLNEEQKNTNKLLERILKVFVATNAMNRSLAVPVKDNNITSDNFINYINKLRQELDNAMVLDREKILDEVDNKISLIDKRIESVIATKLAEPKSKNERLISNNENKSSMFVETCVTIILLILVCFILYKAYKSRFYIPHRRSVSTTPISDPIDTSII